MRSDDVWDEKTVERVAFDSKSVVGQDREEVVRGFVVHSVSNFQFVDLPLGIGA